MQSGRMLVWIFFAYSAVHDSCCSEELSCIQVKQPRSQCDVLNISSKAVQSLPRPLMDFDLLMLQIDRQSMLYPNGEITRMLSSITWKARYEQFKEKILRIPADCHLKEIYVENARRLRTIKVSGTNNVLNVLRITDSAIRKIPTSLQHLHNLNNLFISRGLLDSFNINPLQRLRNLTSIHLSFNKMRRLEVSDDRNLIMPVEYLNLANNLLEYIDMKFFTPFQWLRHLELRSNNLKQILINKPVIFPSLEYLNLGYNELTQVNFSNWVAPKLDTLLLDDNRLIRVPLGIGRFTDLATLHFSGNQLTTLDLQQLEGLFKLKTFNVGENQLHTVLPDCQSRQNASCQQISLPALKELMLGQNFLTSIDFSACDFPSLNRIDLFKNGLKRIHNLNKFPKLNFLDIRGNDIYCLIFNRTDIIYNLHLNARKTNGNSTCPTNSSFPHPYERGIICCNQ